MPLVEGVVAGLLANRAVAASSKARQKAEAIRRDRRISDELGPVATEFNDAFGDRIKARAEDIDNTDLLNLAYKWDVVEDQIDAYEVVFESESDAVAWLVDEIVSIEDVALDETAEEELRDLLADEFATAVAEFRDRIEGSDNLEHRFQADLQIEVLQQLDEMREQFERLFGRRPYGLYKFPEEREAVLETLLPGDPVAFVDREEVPAEPEPDRHFVIAPSGAGKSRIIAERVKRSPDDAFEHVLVPESRMLDPVDAKGLARESFDGDVLLVWEDVHRIDESGENRVLERTLRELAHALDEQGHTLYTLLEARSGRLHNVPGTFPADFKADKGLWSTYDPLWVGDLNEGSLRDLAVAMAEKYEVELDEAARDALVEQTVTAESAPIYIETVFETAAERGDDHLSVSDVAQLPDETSDIWRPIYDDLQDEAPHEWRVLAAMKLLYDLNLPAYSKLVRDVYLDADLLDGDRGRFRSAVRSLRNRGWLTIVGDDVVDVETRYDIHDTQLEPILVSGKDDASELSKLLLEQSADAVPEAVLPAVHFHGGVSFYEWQHYAEAQAQWEISIDINPDNASAHTNYALLLENEFGRFEDAEYHYQQALDSNPELAEAHYNYAVLLQDELGRFEDAEHHYQQALDGNPELAEAYYNYANLLQAELGRFEDAEHHYQQALDSNPDYAKAHTNYALLLEDELGRFEDAEHHYQQALDSNPELVEAHYNYGALLANIFEQEEKAVSHFEESVSLWIDKGNIQNALQDLRLLVRVHRTLNNRADVLDNCELALNLLDQTGEDRPDEKAWFKGLAVVADPDDIEIVQLYGLALENVIHRHQELAMELFEVVWDRRDEHEKESGEYSATIAAGIALAVHIELFDDLESSYTMDGVLTSIDPEDLHSPENVLYQWLSDGEAEESPANLRSSAEEYASDGNQLAALEAQAFAVLLDALQ